MKPITNYIKQMDNLHPLSALIALGIMMLVFVIAQFLTFRFLGIVLEEPLEMMEVRELIKLEFKSQIEKEMPQLIKLQSPKEIIKPSRKSEKNVIQRPIQKSTYVASLAQGFDIKKLISLATSTARKGRSNRSNPKVAEVSTQVDQQNRTLDDIDLGDVLENRDAPFTFTRPSTQNSTGGSKVSIGDNIGTGTRAYSNEAGLALSNRGTNRASRGNNIRSRNGGATISLPSGSGESAILDIHALIKWMKSHPGTIPKLIAYDMGHEREDLSSSVTFTMNSRNYTLFLSCNEYELLLRICLINDNDFTLLKDNGIREASNFLTVGDVVRSADKIQSIISSRKAPGNKANTFYQIFWSWWLRQPESRT